MPCYALCPLCISSPILFLKVLICPGWWLPCHAYRLIAFLILTSPISGWRNFESSWVPVNDFSSWTHLVCNASISLKETSIGIFLASSSSAQRASSYGLIMGQSSVSANLNLTYAFKWLSAIWWITCLSVHPSGLYEQFNCSSDKPLTAFKSKFGRASICETRSGTAGHLSLWQNQIGQ
jgi:hypothetical protein